jgi:uncharacterized protein YjbI with pentapeptide repeats
MMKNLRMGLSNFQNRIRQTRNKLQTEMAGRFRRFKSNLAMHFWNFKIKLPNIALTAPIVGALIILVLGIYFVVVGFRILHPDQSINFYTLLPDFYSNASTTLIGTAFTVLIIDWLNRIRDGRLEKIRLLRDIGCGDHGIALRAILDITANNLHQKGFLRYRIIENAKLAGAMLIGADLAHSSFHHSDFTGIELFGANLQMTSFWGDTLRGADLRDANLSGAFFNYVDLTDARVTPEQLQSANRLHGTRLPNGKIYDGRFNLPVDIQDARASGVDINNPIAMAKWYQMPYDQFMRSMDLRKEKPEIDDWKSW